MKTSFINNLFHTTATRVIFTNNDTNCKNKKKTFSIFLAYFCNMDNHDTPVPNHTSHCHLCLKIYRPLFALSLN